MGPETSLSVCLTCRGPAKVLALFGLEYLGDAPNGLPLKWESLTFGVHRLWRAAWQAL